VAAASARELAAIALEPVDPAVANALANALELAAAASQVASVCLNSHRAKCQGRLNCPSGHDAMCTVCARFVVVCVSLQAAAQQAHALAASAANANSPFHAHVAVAARVARRAHYWAGPLRGSDGQGATRPRGFTPAAAVALLAPQPAELAARARTAALADARAWPARARGR
jgi:hypothetical protein